VVVEEVVVTMTQVACHNHLFLEQVLVEQVVAVLEEREELDPLDLFQKVVMVAMV
tara:strand:- start:318 stop:482 length:165 start_codon:yes stop_codon:yes gene_type:complete